MFNKAAAFGLATLLCMNSAVCSHRIAAATLILCFLFATIYNKIPLRVCTAHKKIAPHTYLLNAMLFSAFALRGTHCMVICGLHIYYSNFCTLLQKCGHPKSSDWLLVHIELTGKGGNRRVHMYVVPAHRHRRSCYIRSWCILRVFFFKWHNLWDVEIIRAGEKALTRSAKRVCWRQVAWKVNDWGHILTSSVVEWWRDELIHAVIARFVRSSVDQVCSPHCIHPLLNFIPIRAWASIDCFLSWKSLWQKMSFKYLLLAVWSWYLLQPN